MYRVRISTWAERGGEREGKQLARADLEAVGDDIFALKALDTDGGLPRNLLRLRTGRAACRRPLEEKTSSL